MSSSFRRAGGAGGRNRRPKSNNKNNSIPSTSNQKETTKGGGTISPFFHRTNPSSTPSPTTATVLKRKGVKPWTNGFSLTSTGLRELDALLLGGSVATSGISSSSSSSGGQALGTCLLIEEDRWTFDLGMCIARYWSAEALSQKQTLLLASMNSDPPSTLPSTTTIHGSKNDNVLSYPSSADVNSSSSPSNLIEFLHSLPRNLHLDKFKSKMKKMQLQQEKEENVRVPFETLEEGDEDEDSDENESDAEKEDKGEEEGLKIAWQYRADVQRTRLGLQQKNNKNAASSSSSRSSKKQNINNVPYCHSYDLSKRMVDQHPPGYFNVSNDIITNKNEKETEEEEKETANAKIVDCTCPPTTNHHNSISNQKYGFWLYRRLLSHIEQNLLPTKQQKKKDYDVLQDDNVIRLLLLNAPPIPTSIALPLLLTYIRAHSLPVVLLVTIRPWHNFHPQQQQHDASSNGTFRSSLNTLRRVSDVSLSLDSFASQRSKPPPEFSDLAGIVTINKCATMTSCSHFDHRASTSTSTGSSKSSSSGVFASAAIAATSSQTSNVSDRYGLRRDRRKLHIRMLHLPPEDFAGGGSSVSGGGARSGGGKKQASTKKKKKDIGGVTGGGSSMGCSSSGGGGTSNPLDF